MHTINIRNINDSMYEKLSHESQKQGLSINELVLQILEKFLDVENNKVGYHDLDDFFGTWTEEEYQRIREGATEARNIDDEPQSKPMIFG